MTNGTMKGSMKPEFSCYSLQLQFHRAVHEINVPTISPKNPFDIGSGAFCCGRYMTLEYRPLYSMKDSRKEEGLIFRSGRCASGLTNVGSDVEFWII